GPPSKSISGMENRSLPERCGLSTSRRWVMWCRALLHSFALVAAFVMHTDARAFDETKYPSWTGYWMRIGAGSFDPTKPPGRGQEAPLTEEYHAILEASLADQAAGGQGNNPMGRCIPPGLPRTMINYEGMEIIILPST